MIRTILIDGQWLLKRNFKAQLSLKSSTGNLCGGVVGFLFSLKTVINKVLPDRVVVAWDGFHSGKLRYDIYPQYKSNRKDKKWANDDKILSTGIATTPEEIEKLELYKQKILTQNILDELFIRQMEVDLIEADDLIAQYVLKSKDDNEKIFIFSRDKDYLQLISDNVSIITSDSLWTLDRVEYEKKYGHTLENELLFKCFEGDTGDCISGVNGIKRETLIKYFPNIVKEKYLYDKLVEECYEAKKDKKIGKRKIYDKVLECRDILYRNAKLMNLKKPFLNTEARKLVDIVKHGTLDEEREITSAIALFSKEGLMMYVGQEYSADFFSPFYMIMTKEKEYSKKMKL